MPDNPLSHTLYPSLPLAQSSPLIPPASTPPKPNQLAFSNLAIGAAVSLFEVTTLGQPLEVLKTHMAANRTDSLREAVSKTVGRGGFSGFYQGLLPWAWIESSTTGALLLFTSSFVESFSQSTLGLSSATSGLLGGVAGGAAQAYGAMGICTNMKTAEITRLRHAIPSAIPGQPAAPLPSTLELFMQMYRTGGIRAINKGVNAVAVRQMTNWGSRMGFARATEGVIRRMKGVGEGEKLTGGEKVLASAVGGALGCWNHPIEVIRVEMQSLKSSAVSASDRPRNLTMVSTFKYIYKESGWKGFFRGVSPRIALGVWRTICLVSLGDHVKAVFASSSAAKAKGVSSQAGSTSTKGWSLFGEGS